MRYLRDKKGTSIIEVLVVMVVLLIGILVIVNLFPPGFASVRRSMAMTLAGRLAQQDMERWANKADNLPEGVVPIGTDDVVLNTQYPGPPVDDNNSSTMRRIIGEATRIPFGGWSTNPEDNGSIYVLAYAPIDIQLDASGNPTNFAVRGGALTRRVMDSSQTEGTPAWVALSPSQYGIDYDDMKIVFPVAAINKIYYMNISWWEQSGSSAPVYKSATSIPINVPANTQRWLTIGATGSGADITLPTTTAPSELDAYGETVSRGFIQVATFSTDPYEYRMVNAALGVIAFNPLGYAQKEFGRPLEARIDYDILNLEIIHEDKRIPSTSPYKVSMTLDRIKQYNVSTEIDGTLYQGIKPFTNPPSHPVDFIAVDLQTGWEVDLTEPTTSSDGAIIDYKAGTVTFVAANASQPPTLRLNSGGGAPTVVPAAGRNLRFFYQAEGDWSLAFHKAYYQFTSEDNANSPLNYATYRASNADLNFAACNANDTMSVTYEWDDNGTTRKVVGECHKTSDQITNNETKITLNHIPSRIFSVNGVSVRVRACWRDSDKWRNVDLDTTLLRKPGT